MKSSNAPTDIWNHYEFERYKFRLVQLICKKIRFYRSNVGTRDVLLQNGEQLLRKS